MLFKGNSDGTPTWRVILRAMMQFDQTTVFLLIWAFTIAVFYQLMATKYTTYTFPYLLPIAILAARVMVNHLKLVKYTRDCQSHIVFRAYLCRSDAVLQRLFF